MTSRVVDAKTISPNIKQLKVKNIKVHSFESIQHFNLSQEFTTINKLPPEKVSVLSPPIIGQYLRVNPRSWKTPLSMAIEFYGCYLVDNRNGKRFKPYIWIVQRVFRIEQNKYAA